MTPANALPEKRKRMQRRSPSSVRRVRAQIRGGVQAFREARPALVFVTSAGVERNALIGDDEAARKADIPIVQASALLPTFAGVFALHFEQCTPNHVFLHRMKGGSPP